MLAAELAAGIAAIAGDGSQPFLPYCDTGEDTLVVDAKGKFLFDQDCRRLADLDLFVGILHGPSYDDGVCMEIGFAYALGNSILIMISDFLTYTWGDHTESSVFADPLFELVTTEVVRYSSPIPKSSVNGPGSSKAAYYQSFWQQNRAALDLTLDKTIRAARKLLSAPKPGVTCSPGESENLIFVEISGLSTEELPKWVSQVTATALEHGWDIYICKRHRASNSRVETMDLAKEDLEMASKSKVLILDGNGAEVPSGSAMLVGYALAKQRETLLIYSAAQTTHARGREANARNLMLLYGSRRIIRSEKDIGRELKLVLSQFRPT